MVCVYKESAFRFPMSLRRLITAVLIIALIAPSMSMASSRHAMCEATDQANPESDICYEEQPWSAPVGQSDVIVTPGDTSHHQPPGYVHGEFRTAYVDSRTGNAYEIVANLDTGRTVLYNAAGFTLKQGQMSSTDLALFQDASKRYRNGEPQAGTLIEAALLTLAVGLILAVVTNVLDGALANNLAQQECRRGMARDANTQAAAAQACQRSGGKYVVTSSPSLSNCGGGAGYCGPK